MTSSGLGLCSLPTVSELRERTTSRDGKLLVLLFPALFRLRVFKIACSFHLKFGVRWGWEANFGQILQNASNRN